jgi:hypothetical protein
VRDGVHVLEHAPEAANVVGVDVVPSSVLPGVARADARIISGYERARSGL